MSQVDHDAPIINSLTLTLHCTFKGLAFRHHLHHYRHPHQEDC